MTTVALASLGCKANQYDGGYMAALLRSRGFSLVDFKSLADIYVINTCTVTDGADLDSRNIIRRAQRRNPEATIVVTGCYAQTRPEEIAALGGVHLILGNAQKASLVDQLEIARRERDKIHVAVEDIFRQRELESFGMSSDTTQTRAYVKIQDGCNQFCSFCIIPFARGRNRSISIDRILAELRQLQDRGFREAILTGIHLGTYGHDLTPKTNLAVLLRAIEVERPIHRVRVSSIDPEEIDREIIDIFSDAKTLCPHLHLPLQSGDDDTLKLMRRRYRREDFARVAAELKAGNPELTLGTDVIVGFPYEDEARFRASCELLETSPVDYFHVFPFSPKRGTPAARMLGQVDPAARRRRATALRELSERKAQAWRRRFLGHSVEAILERRLRLEEDANLRKTLANIPENYEFWTGFSRNYLALIVARAGGGKGLLTQAKILSEEGEQLVAYA